MGNRRQTMGGAAQQDLAPVIEKGLQHLLEGHHAGHARRIQHVHVEPDAGLQLGLAEQHLHQEFRLDRAAPGLQHDAHVLGRFVTHVREQGELAGLEQLGDALNQPRLLHLIGNLGDHDLVLAAADALLLPPRADTEAAPSRRIGLRDLVPVLDQDTAGREVRPRHQRHQGIVRELGVFQQRGERVAELAGVVGRDAGGEAHGYSRRPVGEQVGKGRRQHHGLAVAAVVGLTEIDRVLVQAVEQRLRDFREPRLRVAHCRGVIAVDVAEVALPLDQRVARGEGLGEPHQGVVDRRIAVGVVLADHVAHDPRALLEARVGVEFEGPHGVEETALNRLEPVAHVGQRARGDGGERVGQIALAQRIAEGHGLDRALRYSLACDSRHDSRYSTGGVRVKGLAPSVWWGPAWPLAASGR